LRYLASAAMFVALLLTKGYEAHAHGMMVRPLPRQNLDAVEALDKNPGCVGNGCLYFSDNMLIPEPTYVDKEVRTWNIEEKYMGDWTKTHPWRSPGHASPWDPCGCLDVYGNPCKSPGSQLPVHADRIETWTVGGTAWAWWAIQFNHGGGYQYRLCPKSQPMTNECFEETVLEFATSTYTVRYDGRLMAGTPDAVLAAVDTSVGTKPAGSKWRKNPIPHCNCDNPARGCKSDPKYNPQQKAYEQQTMPSWYAAHRAKGGYNCDTGFQFPPPAEGVYGIGAAGNDFNKNAAVFRIGDELRVPTHPGEYVLQWRWDTEGTKQVWSSCADIRIQPAANVTV